MESESKSNVILVTEDSLQTSLLKEILENKLRINVFLLSPDKLIAFKAMSGHISTIILDSSVVNDEMYTHYMELKKAEFSAAKEILINCDKSIPTEELFVWSCLSGIFYNSDDIHTLQIGIGKILQGEMWFSRKFSQQYITHLRRHFKPISRNSNTVLTKRERQIITFLSMGASNQQIAENLFVSENTVKTHLHNIFKKIEVKNRVQALIWAKDNISNTQEASY
ncbi:LuxR C-terminal-related transcriptional regulator [Vibrio rotiferianus]|uniref:LuxR C-terminal-related transcriptional regulator n=1 Tax=Vibrio rotiferianus TaxID=190895 RepID=UPI000B59C94D|nr:LuxR C-terminal-related transcriptional regulator [Vibrio rotiferianus]ASI93874.1 helix-turn-helix transcriptional regulator [Vibrio rotiferianus]